MTRDPRVEEIATAVQGEGHDLADRMVQWAQGQESWQPAYAIALAAVAFQNVLFHVAQDTLELTGSELREFVESSYKKAWEDARIRLGRAPEPRGEVH
jgi:hypothetical protein